MFFKKLTFTILLILLVQSRISAKEENSVDISLEKLNWQVDLVDVKDLQSITKNEVETFINKYWIKQSDILKANIGEYIFSDVNNDGVYELLLTYDVSGRGFFNWMVIIHKVDTRYEFEELAGFNIQDLAHKIIDLNNDGKKEILTTELMTDYEGVRPMAFWTSVYEWNGQRYVRADKRFSKYYRSIFIPQLLKKIKAIQTSKKTELEKEIESSFLYLPLDRAIRLTGENRNAGFERAVKWTESDNEILIENAIIVFEEITDRESVKYLKKITNYDNRILVEKAQKALEKIKRRQ